MVSWRFWSPQFDLILVTDVKYEYSWQTVITQRCVFPFRLIAQDQVRAERKRSNRERNRGFLVLFEATTWNYVSALHYLIMTLTILSLSLWSDQRAAGSKFYKAPQHVAAEATNMSSFPFGSGGERSEETETHKARVPVFSFPHSFVTGTTFPALLPHNETVIPLLSDQREREQPGTSAACGGDETKVGSAELRSRSSSASERGNSFRQVLDIKESRDTRSHSTAAAAASCSVWNRSINFKVMIMGDGRKHRKNGVEKKEFL